MNLIEAAKSGHSFYRKSKSYLKFKPIKEANGCYGFDADDILADDWEIDKPKKRYWLWVVKTKAGGLGITANHYDDNGYIHDGDKSSFVFIQKIENEFIEI